MALSLDLPMQDGDGSTDIKADTDRLRQITTNLISNVLRHASSGHWLSIRRMREAPTTRIDRSWVILEVGVRGPALLTKFRPIRSSAFVQAPEAPPGRLWPGPVHRQGSVRPRRAAPSARASPSVAALFTVRFPRL